VVLILLNEGGRRISKVKKKEKLRKTEELIEKRHRHGKEGIT
jgi:hypothetical protein